MSIQDRKREAARSQIERVALELFVRSGFDATTADDVAAAAGVSRRTFFRYFPAKEDVVVGWFERLGDELGDLVAARPADEPSLTAVHEALGQLAERHGAERDHVLALWRLAESSASVRARRADKHERWVGTIAAALVARNAVAVPGHDPGSGLEPEAEVAARIGLAAFDVAFARWVGADGEADMRELLEDAFAWVARVVRASAVRG